MYQLLADQHQHVAVAEPVVPRSGPRRSAPEPLALRVGRWVYRRPEEAVEVRTVDSWTSQEGTARTLAFMSADPTVSILGEAAGEASLEPLHDSRFCRDCGSLFLHRSHLRSVSCSERMTEASLRGGNAVTLMVVAHMAPDPIVRGIL
ncbi:hypothetical protein HPB47_007014 [Ixodes persulcatus]|uniref:Uncharacterized protein n=1 Tax=Ixodes persulcatus TaxID=34615 RepID=A0AC60P994_IXOPE|nr:hypothetical protein HPB47_007014 [Ixodes persulcatus]